MEKEKVDVLIVVDMQNDFVTGPLGTPEAQAIVPKVVEKIKSWKGEILYTQDTHYDNYLETQEGKHLPVKHCIEHTRGWLFVDEIEHNLLPEMKDPQAKIYEKRTFGSTLLMEDYATLISLQLEEWQILRSIPLLWSASARISVSFRMRFCLRQHYLKFPSLWMQVAVPV